METTLENKIKILSELWFNYRNDEEFVDFAEYNDIGLPLAYLLQEKIVEPTKIAKDFIGETFDLLVSALDIEDTGFENLDEMLSAGIEEE